MYNNSSTNVVPTAAVAVAPAAVDPAAAAAVSEGQQVPLPTNLLDDIGDVVIGKYWKSKYKIGCGSFGEIYLGVDIRNNEHVAIKVESTLSKYPQLEDEHKVYRHVGKALGVPNVLWFGQLHREDNTAFVNVMVMDLLGDSLEALYNRCGRKFSLKTVTMLAVQLIHRIEHHHNCHYLHRDIKPDNFLMGTERNQHLLYMIDMGLCKQYRDPNTLQHIGYREKKKLIGTPRYASINTHLGREQCRRDDLESIGYMLVYFLAGKLPWQGLKAKTKQEKYDRISEKKINITVEHLCKGLPETFSLYLAYCRDLKFVQKPDYKYLRSLFYCLHRQQQYEDDCVYDWMVPSQPTKLPTGILINNVSGLLAHIPNPNNATTNPVVATAAAAAAAATHHQQQQENERQEAYRKRNAVSPALYACNKLYPASPNGYVAPPPSFPVTATSVPAQVAHASRIHAASTPHRNESPSAALNASYIYPTTSATRAIAARPINSTRDRAGAAVPIAGYASAYQIAPQMAAAIPERTTHAIPTNIRSSFPNHHRREGEYAEAYDPNTLCIPAASMYPSAVPVTVVPAGSSSYSPPPPATSPSPITVPSLTTATSGNQTGASVAPFGNGSPTSFNNLGGKRKLTGMGTSPPNMYVTTTTQNTPIFSGVSYDPNVDIALTTDSRKERKLTDHPGVVRRALAHI